MQVSKWGNSLAIRLPSTVVEELRLKEGDEIEIRATSPREFLLARSLTKDQAIEGLRQLGWHLPADFKFDREEANAR
jgi:antitoxin MazE